MVVVTGREGARRVLGAPHIITHCQQWARATANPPHLRPPFRPLLLPQSRRVMLSKVLGRAAAPWQALRFPEETGTGRGVRLARSAAPIVAQARRLFGDVTMSGIISATLVVRVSSSLLLAQLSAVSTGDVLFLQSCQEQMSREPSFCATVPCSCSVSSLPCSSSHHPSRCDHSTQMRQRTLPPLSLACNAWYLIR